MHTHMNQGPDLQNISRFIIRLYKFIVRSTYDSDLKRAEISLSDDIMILHVNLTYGKLSIHCKMLCKLDVRGKSIVTLALS